MASRGLKRKGRAATDIALALLLTIPINIVLWATDAFHHLLRIARTYHHEAGVEEVLTVTFIIGMAAVVYSARRVFDLRREIGRRAVAEQEARRLARHDVLTGLPNRRQLQIEFNKQRGRRTTDAARSALFMIDLDNFKPINDLHGHAAGDEVLRGIAQRLKELDESAVVARLGGDEFALLTPCEGDSEKLLRIARRIVSDIAKPIVLSDASVRVGASVGIAIYPDNGTNLETLARQADIAMYDAKAQGRGTFRFFDQDMDERLKQRIELERELQTAIRTGQIVPYYQPLVDLESGATLGHEVLARWQHPHRGLLSPTLFIPIAEDIGLIGELTYSILRRACQEARDWPADLYLSVNLSPTQITDPWLAQELLGILTECHFPAHRLEVEITETALMHKLDEVRSALQSLRNLGIRIAIDDFGTGYSGLYHLRELDFDILKIDRSFVLEMLNKPEQGKIIEAIMGLSKALGLRATAEGIETEGMLDRLKELGCTTGQGFLFGKPQPAEEIRRGLAKDTHAEMKIA